MTITVQELKQKLDQKEDFLLLDVREPHEYEEFNIGAKLIPLGNIPVAVDDLEDYREKEIVVHCRSGARSASAQQFLIGVGFKDVKNLTGGVLAWQEAFK
ncbi:MAG: rhodanese-like domain-containing protein [Bacteroidota bacterium]